MWKKAVLWSALKKAEANVKTEEETNQGATFNQVVQKSLIPPPPLQELSQKLPLPPIFFLHINCSVSKHFTTAILNQF